MARNVAKLKDRDVQELVTNHDIIGFLESHTDENSSLEVDGYTTVHSPRNRHAGKMYGGVVALIKNDIIEGIDILDPTEEGCIWLELKANFFNLEHNVMIGFAYVEPGMTKTMDPMKFIRRGMERCDPTCPVIIMGDINARVGDVRACNNANT